MALIRVAKSRWNFATGLTFAALLGLATCNLPGADTAKKTGTKDDDPKAGSADVMRDVTELVEVTVNGGLLSSNKTNHSAAVSIKNTSKEDLAGPLVVVIDETGIATLSVKDPTGMLEGDKPYVEVLDKRGTLKAGRSLRTQKIEFETDEALAVSHRQQFNLKLRVLYLPESARIAKSNKNSKGEDLIEGKKYSEQDVARVATIQEKWTIPFMQRGNGDIYGTAIGEDKDGNLVVKVYTQREELDNELPDQVDGIPVQPFVTGVPFTAAPARNPGAPILVNGVPKKPGEGLEPVPDNGPQAPVAGSNQPYSGAPGDPTIRFPRPVPIGVSIANVDRLLFALDCYAGTLGCRCVDPLGNQYILTNAHVGGEVFIVNAAPPPREWVFNFPGERIVQTSTLDMLPVRCFPDLNNLIGFLSDWEIIPLWQQQEVINGIAIPSLMDASVIRAIPNGVQAETPDDGYGAPKRTLAKPQLGTPVQKYGRTTVYTSGQVTGINVSAAVVYDTPLVGYFIKQVEIANLAGANDILQSAPFSSAGDSGSLIVVRNPGHESDRQPLALLFAGGPSGEVDITLANPLAPILARFNLSIDDGSGTFGSQTSGTMGGVIGPHDPPSDFK